MRNPKRVLLVTHDGKPLSADQVQLFRTMNDPAASMDDRTAAALALLPVMHKPVPPIVIVRSSIKVTLR